MKLSRLNIKQAVNSGVWVDILMITDFEYTAPDGTVVQLREGDPSGMSLRLLGTDSDVYQTMQEKAFAARLKKKGGAKEPETLAEADARAVDLLVALTVDWKGFDDDNGNPIPFSEQAIRAVYADSGYKWLRDQADLAANQRRRFFVT